ncbi:FKBP12-associated protein 1 homolog [Schizosaccharomyces pombe 972h-] [Rhizoctonia solani]|uniref:FKBP12-associated protein 1 homolog [Schizosaccharomyces pombe 972h-] n=1 Tax=Rhizoctonia solani TaxID=456999 RepID=A0A0K6GEU1_9AGAM|nr:FKBP12-associated protein 1 homolog [Schizosaccharomyces pombe 972h-] [Rhizoctonia solani]
MSALPADRGPPSSASLATTEAPAPRPRGPNRRGRGRRNRSPHPDNLTNGTGQAPVPNSGAPRGRGRTRNRPSRQEGVGTTGGEAHQLPPHLATESQGDISATESTGSHNQPRRGRGGGSRGNRNSNRGTQASGRGGRRQHFGARLTEGGAQPVPLSSEPPPPPPTSGDLTSRLIYSLTHKHDALDCPICFNPVHPAQPIWSCGPPPTLVGDTSATCCWTIFHMKCIKEWARKSVEATREAYRARSVDLPGQWRCPGCQTKRTAVPQTYVCFCGRATNPAPSQLSTPHSCGEPCARVRKECEHACPLACHPGPCPPCLVSVSKDCWCGSKTIVSRCSVLNKNTTNGSATVPTLSCGQPCGRLLGCEKHTCQLECHPGPCTPCQVVDVVRCYCGKHEKDMSCGAGIPKDCSVEGQAAWEGRWQCEEICDRGFNCGKHKCQKPCHPPSKTPAICPLSPSLIATCPCTKTPLSVERTACTDPIPTCAQPCSKAHAECGHACTKVCHTGPCPPCTLPVAVKCRCGETTSQIPCNALVDGQHILCQKMCKAMRGCGRHECNRVCCPLAGTAGRSKGKRKLDLSAAADSTDDDPEGWHTCDLVCNKRLSCGNHNCMLPDHRGPCPRCLQSSFEELVCPCNRTIIEAPVPCGTRMNCTYPCAAPPPPCGHPRTPHTCHAAEEESSCPPCPHLTNRQCDCGKSLVRNVRCSQERTSCGAPCGKPLDCGYHSCDRTCHVGDCGSCAQICGKPRKKCGHPCPVPCHAPSACPSIDAVACPTVITVTCPCGRITQPAPCGASRVLKCQDACLIAKRNVRLADALGISEGGRSSGHNQITWNPNLIAFARAPANQPFVKNMEKALADFVAGDKKAHVLPYMPEVRRKIVTEVAEVYRITTQLVDEEPRRSVQLIRRIDSRVPAPLLSQASASTPSRLGSLGDLRKPATVVKSAPSGGPGASTSSAWRSGTPPSHIPNATSNLTPNSGSPTSGNLPPGFNVTSWARPNVVSTTRTPIISTASWMAPVSLERAHTGETREDVPANWEDE